VCIWYQDILGLWFAGSVAFTMGPFFLGFRHFVMGV
jgi:hypothetical protein